MQESFAREDKPLIKGDRKVNTYYPGSPDMERFLERVRKLSKSDLELEKETILRSKYNLGRGQYALQEEFSAKIYEIDKEIRGRGPSVSGAIAKTRERTL